MTRQPIRSSARRRRSARGSEVPVRGARIAAVALALALGACTVVVEQSGGESGMPEGAPAGAIQVGEDRYMVPVDMDAGGCERFTPWSASAPVKTAIYYRKADGSFVLNREEAACATADG